MLQQLLPFTVLKLLIREGGTVFDFRRLQQLLPFTVLKLFTDDSCSREEEVATALTVYGIETKVSDD